MEDKGSKSVCVLCVCGGGEVGRGQLKIHKETKKGMRREN